MLAALAVAEAYISGYTWLVALRFRFAIGIRGAIQAMGRMEHGHMTVENHFEFGWIGMAGHIGKGALIQVKGGVTRRSRRCSNVSMARSLAALSEKSAITGIPARWNNQIRGQMLSQIPSGRRL